MKNTADKSYSVRRTKQNMSCLHQIVLFVARKNQGSLKMKTLVDSSFVKYYSNSGQYFSLKTIVLR